MDDDAIISGMRRGDPAAVNELVDTYGTRLLRSAYFMCGNEQDAQDLTQETLVVAARRIRQFHCNSSLYHWLHGILWNLNRNRLRKKRSFLIFREILPQDAIMPSGLTARLDMNANEAMLDKAIATLPAGQRDVIILRFYEDMKVEDIARRLAIKPGTVKSRLHTALQALRKKCENK